MGGIPHELSQVCAPHGRPHHHEFAFGDGLVRSQPHIGKRGAEHGHDLFGPLLAGWQAGELLVLDEVVCEKIVDHVQVALIHDLLEEVVHQLAVLLGRHRQTPRFTAD